MQTPRMPIRDIVKNLSFFLFITLLTLGHALACDSGLNAFNKSLDQNLSAPPAHIGHADDALNFTNSRVIPTQVIQENLVFRQSTAVNEITEGAEVVVARSGNRWTKGVVGKPDERGFLEIHFVEDGIEKIKPVSAQNLLTNIKVVDEPASLFLEGRKVMISRTGGGSSPGYITGYDQLGRMRVDFFDEASQSWAHKILKEENIAANITPMSRQVALKIEPGTSVEIFSRTDNAFNRGIISKVDGNGGVHVEYLLKDGRSASKVIAANNIDSFLKPGKNIDDLNGVNSIKKYFADAPTHTQGADLTFMAKRALPNGDRAYVNYMTPDRDFAKAQGKLFEAVSPKDLPKGQSYTYIVREDGKMVFGVAEDGWEFGVKHAHLANGDKVMAAGEITIDASGAFKWNLESGSFTRKLVESGKTDMVTLEKQMKNVFQDEFGNTGKFTDEILLNSGPPTPERLRALCSSAQFLVLNRNVCQTLGLQ